MIAVLFVIGVLGLIGTISCLIIVSDLKFRKHQQEEKEEQEEVKEYIIFRNFTDAIKYCDIHKIDKRKIIQDNCKGDRQWVILKYI